MSDIGESSAFTTVVLPAHEQIVFFIQNKMNVLDLRKKNLSEWWPGIRSDNFYEDS